MKKNILSILLVFTSAIAAMANGHTITFKKIDASCNGSNDGSASAYVAGGIGPFTYSWAPTGGTDWTASGLTAGSYTVTVTDQNDMSTATASVTINQTTIVCVITAYDATCGNANGKASVTESGGASPITWSWAPSGSITPTIAYLTAGTYTTTATDANGCTASATATINNKVPDIAICMVTTDSLSKNNIIVWEKPIIMSVDSFIVYREITANNYQPIGAVPYDSLSEFIDTDRTKYAPNTGDPNTGSYRYKIQARASCGDHGAMSPYHNTIYITNSNGTFSWPQLYTIENGTNPVTSYNLMRDDNSTGNWHQVNSVAGTIQTVSDPQYSTYQNTASWRVETYFSFNCTPTRSFTKSISNTYRKTITGIKEIPNSDVVKVYPNPLNDNTTFTIQSSKLNETYSFELMDILGKQAILVKEIGTKEFQISRNGLPNGIYFYKIYNTESVIGIGKLVIE